MPTVLCICEMLNQALPNACAYIRLILPLTKSMVRDEVAVRFVRLQDLKYCKGDVVIVQRFALNDISVAQQLTDYCTQMRARLIVDLDDDILSVPTWHPERTKYEAMKHVALRLIADADELWVSTPSLAARFAGVAQQITVMPNQLDDRVWALPPLRGRLRIRPVRFIYMGTVTHRADFEQLVRPAWRQLKAEFGSNIELDLVGIIIDTPVDCEWTTMNPPGEVASSYPAFVTWLQGMPQYDVGLAPLIPDGFNGCKSDIKWLEYSALGLATIAAECPAYKESIEHGRTGLLADATAEGFYDAMRRLIIDTGLRQSLQRHASMLAAKKLITARSVEPRLDRLRNLTAASPSAAIRVSPARPIAAPDVLFGRIDRSTLSQAFLHGSGIEIGALQKPLPVPSHVRVTYVDRLSKHDLRIHYPELRPFDLVEVDVLDNGETLATFQSESQDFVIANHFIEHSQDPIQTIKNFTRVLRSGGIIYLAVPDKRQTFDRDRDLTGLSHLVEDHICGPARSREQHYREWVTLVEPHFGAVHSGQEAIAARVNKLMMEDYSIHFHTFTPEAMRALLDYCIEKEEVPLAFVFSGELGEEMIFVLRRTDSIARSSEGQTNVASSPTQPASMSHTP